MHTSARLHSAADGWHIGPEMIPESRGELRPGDVLGADEHDPTDLQGTPEAEIGEDGWDETHVTAPSVALGTDPFHEAQPLQDAEMVSQQVGVDAQGGGKLGGSAVRHHELVDDEQAVRVSECRVQPCTFLKSVNLH
jgi:hypothetical protein